MSRLHNFLMRRVADSAGAVSEAMFPSNDFGAPDWKDAEMVPRTVTYLEVLPPRSRNLLMLLYVAVEFSAPLLLVWPGRFSKAPLSRRKNVLAKWRTHWFYPLKMLADGLKAQLCMTYLSHPTLQDYIRAWKSCDRPLDAYSFPIEPDPFDPDSADGFKVGVQQEVREKFWPGAEHAVADTVDPSSPGAAQ